MNIALIGMRSTGKSNISRRLSVKTKWPVLSTDLLISYENNGLSIPDIVANSKGDWRGFRDMEYAVIAKCAALDKAIIDCGGGVIVDLDQSGKEIYSSRKMDALKKNCTIIWLKGDIPRLAAKVAKDAGRPSLSEIESAEEIMVRRMPFYEQAADIVVDIEEKKRSEIATEILRALEYSMKVG
ncbi:MAG: shikimate kinase [Magnetococcales bacterium]|nr:shikimate kinase [Magnetococcales bacterium]